MTDIGLAATGVTELFKLGFFGVILGLCLVALGWFVLTDRKDRDRRDEENRKERKELVETLKNQADDYKKSIESIFSENKQSLSNLSFGVESLRDRMATNCPRFHQ